MPSEVARTKESRAWFSFRRVTTILVVLVVLSGVWVGLWYNGVVGSPLLERVTGLQPAEWTKSVQGPSSGTFVVTSPFEQEILSTDSVFEGVARPGSSVYVWEEGQNVPLITTANADGAWSVKFSVSAMTVGAHVLGFADTNGESWSNVVYRSVSVAPEEPTDPHVPFFLKWLVKLPNAPGLQIFRPITQPLADVAIRVGGSNDLNNDGVSDKVQSSVASPTSIPAALTPYVQSPAWLNLLIAVVVVLTPVIVLIVRNPSWLGPVLAKWIAVRAWSRDRKRRAALVDRRLRLGADLRREELRLRQKHAQQELKTAEKWREKALKARGLVFQQSFTSKVARTQAVAGAKAAEAAARAAVARAEADVAKYRAMAESANKRAPNTVINIRGGDEA